MGNWFWDVAQKQYRSTKADPPLSHTDMIRLRNEFAEAQQEYLRGLTDGLSDDSETVDAWKEKMRTGISAAFLGEYMLGLGGRRNLNADDEAWLSDKLDGQYEYLDGFAGDILDGRYTDEEGKLSTAAVAARAALYAAAAICAFERAYARTHGEFDLPAWPGDGSTQCYGNCRCYWEIVEVEGGWDCYWELGEAEHCPDCLERADEWAPYHVDAET